MKFVRKGTLDPAKMLKIMSPVDRVLSRNLSKTGRYIRRNQLKYIAEALKAENLRAWTSVLFPAEILHPFGVLPLSLEILSGIFSTVGLSREFLNISQSFGAPQTICSFHRLLVGLAKSRYFAPPKFVAATSLLCDGNLKSFAEAARESGSEFVYLDIPFEETAHSVKYLKEQLEAAARKFAEGTGQRYSLDAVKHSVTLADKGLKLLSDIWSKRISEQNNLFRGYEMANFCFPSHYLLGSPLLIDLSNRVLKGLADKTDRNKKYKTRALSKKAKRLMWMHIVPQYDTRMWDLLDDGVNAKIVCEEYTAPYCFGYDVNDPFGSIARRLIRHPSNGPLSRRVEHSLSVAKDFNVDGVVHYSSWGCHQATGNVSIIEKEFEKWGFKFLNLNGDAVDANNTTFEQHRTRIEAFLEDMFSTASLK